MKHCTSCWLKDNTVSEATYIYEGNSLCRPHLTQKYNRLVEIPTDPKPEPKTRTKSKKQS